MGKRANGEGSVSQRPNGGWEARLSYIDGNTGQRRRQSFYARTQRDARSKMADARKRLEAGAPVRDATCTVGNWLAHWRATTLAASSRKQSTRELYENLSRRHLEPAPFGQIPLDKLKPSDVESLILSMRGKTRADGTRALSDSSIRSAYAVLRQALDGAVRDGLLARNPVALVPRPSVAASEVKSLNPGQISAILRAAEDSRYYTALALIASTGLRRGEALALRWDCVDLEAGTLKVRKTLGRVGGRLISTEPKTQRARRTVPLSPPVVALLKKHRAVQSVERMKAANLWEENGLVFCTERGTPVDPRNLSRVFEIAASAAGVTGATVHTLRHSAATAWLERGVHIKAVSDLLGHSSIAITGDIYGHTSDDTAKTAIELLSADLEL